MTNLPLNNLQQYEQLELRYPTSIQPYGVLLVIDIKTLTIIQVSENTREFLGITSTTLLGKPLTYLMSSKQIEKIQSFLSHNDPEFVDVIKLKKKKEQTNFKVIVHTIQDSIILELEPLGLENNHPIVDPYNLLKNTVNTITISKNSEHFLATITKEIRKIVKFDRVLIYRFKHDNSGVVIAENKREDIDSYLGLHYPAYDIPAVAREFFCNNLLRVIPNVSYESIPLTPHQHPLKHEDLDLSRSVLRGVHPCHIEYLKNMGVTATMSIPLKNENRLWGLIACHHYSPKYVSFEIRKICEFLGQFLSVELLYKQEQEFSKYRKEIKKIQTSIKEKLLKSCNQANFISHLLQDNGESLLNLIDTQGVAICLDQNITVKGNTLSQKQIKALVNDFLVPKQQDIFATDSLRKIYPPSREFKEVAAGILALSISLNSSTYHIIWFRPEQTYQVQWAGNPYDVQLITNSQGIPQLCPRNSFLKWKETVIGKSLPWQSLEIEAAEELRSTLLLAVLGYSQWILEETTKKANQANLAKGQFLAKMSHELRTPLNAILGFTQMMNQDECLSSEQQKYVGIINRSGEHLLSLINDVLEMSRIEAGQLILHKNNFDLYKLIQSVQELLAFKASSKEIILNCHIDKNLPQYLEGDEGKLRQIIVNLVGNAIKFTKVGYVDLHLSFLSTEIDNKEITLQLQVKDTGIGIKKEDLETVFEAFKQTETAFQTDEGTGLGLSISRQFARLMGGDITVETELGKGVDAAPKNLPNIP